MSHLRVFFCFFFWSSVFPLSLSLMFSTSLSLASIRVALPGYGTAAARAALPISDSEFSILCVSKQYQCLGFLMCAQMLIRAIAQRGYTDTVREFAPEADWEKNALPHRNSNPRQFYVWLFAKRATNHEQFATRTRARHPHARKTRVRTRASVST